MNPASSLKTAVPNGIAGQWPRWLACLLVLGLYVMLPNWGHHGYQSERYYPGLANAFLRGELNIAKDGADALSRLADPYDPKLNTPIRDENQIGDLSFYRGKFYMYFGAAPAVLLFAPFRFITGRDLPQPAAGLLFCFIGFLALVDCHGIWTGRQPAPRRPWISFLEVIALGTANFAPVLLSRMWVYETAISAGFCFLAIALAALLRASRAGGGARLAMLGISGLSCGLAVGSRANLLVGCAPIAAAVVMMGGAGEGRSWIRRHLPGAAAFLSPLAICLLGLCWYNFARFSDPFEFGQKYQLTAEKVAGMSFFSLRNVPSDLLIYVFRLPRLSPYFPFLYSPAAPVRIILNIHARDEGTVGLGLFVPLIWFCIPAAIRHARVSAWKDCAAFPALLIAVSLANLATILCISATAARYCMDFLPMLALCAILGRSSSDQVLAAKDGQYRPGAWILRLYAVACLGSVVFVCCYAVQYRSLFKAAHPRVEKWLFGVFDLPTFAWEKLVDRKFGAVEIRFRPGAYSNGKEIHGLFYCSGPPASEGGASGDYLKCGFVTGQPHPGECQIGYVRRSGGIVWGLPFSPGASGICTARFCMGSLFPPDEHPFFSGMDARKAYTLVSRIQVDVDGRTVLQGYTSRLDCTYPSVHWRFPVPYLSCGPFDGSVLSWSYCTAPP